MQQESNTHTQQTVEDLTTKAKEGMETTFSLVRALEEGQVPTLKIERRLLNPETPEELPREESRRRQHTFYAASGFIDYLRKFGSSNTVLFADAEARRVEAVLDELAPRGREVVCLSPQIHPRWEPWREMLDQKIDLDGLRDLITGNRRSIVEPEGRHLIFMLRQIRMSTDVQLQSGVIKGGAAAVNGLIIRTKVTSGGDEADTLELPKTIKVRTPVLVDEPEQDVEMDLILSGSRDGTQVRAQLGSADLREAEISAFDGLVKRLRDELGSDEEGRFTVTHGRVDEGAWARLPSLKGR